MTTNTSHPRIKKLLKLSNFNAERARAAERRFGC
jgi:hypothetical protein